MPPSGDESEDDAPKLVRRSTLAPSIKLCPRCLAPLSASSKLGGWLIPQDYYCTKCGYAGMVYVESADGSPPEGKK